MRLPLHAHSTLVGEKRVKKINRYREQYGYCTFLKSKLVDFLATFIKHLVICIMCHVSRTRDQTLREACQGSLDNRELRQSNSATPQTNSAMLLQTFSMGLISSSGKMRMWEMSLEPLSSNLKSLYLTHQTSLENPRAPPLQLYQQRCLPIIFYVPPQLD